MNNLEILAPVGVEDRLIAAVRAGADAVYFGAANFNARRNAQNFSRTEFSDAIKYCHSHGVKVYITLNTLICDDEIPSLVDELKFIAKLNADALIVQDLAVAKLAKEISPELPLHASTQMTVHNISGVKTLEDMGFSRVVLPRELNLSEIENIAKNTKIEIETFIHGAMCMSVSGMCYISSMLGGRSGNRGLCAQSCRLDFNARGREYALSLKDMSYVNHIEKLRDAGVKSLKIEGRMKRAEYVACAVDTIKKAVSGEEYDLNRLSDVFSRQGFSDGYLLDKRDINMFGYRTKDDVIASNAVLKSIHEIYRKERGNIAVNMQLTLKNNAPMTLSCVDVDNNEVFVEGDIPNEAKDKPLDENFARKSLQKCGDTPFYLDNLTVENKDNLMCSAASLNSLRRNALEKLIEIRAEKRLYDKINTDYEYIPKMQEKHSGNELRIRFEKYEQVFENDAEFVIFPIDEILNHPELLVDFNDRLVCELPSLVFEEDEKAFRLKLEKIKEAGVKTVSVDNISELKIAQDYGFSVLGGYGLNILNSISLDGYSKLGVKDCVLSFEMSAKRINNIQSSVKRGILAYGYLPLMKFRNCPNKTKKGCDGCTGTTEITDRMGINFPLICRNKKYSILLNSLPLDVTDRDIQNIDFRVLYFTIESKSECRNIYLNAKNCVKNDIKSTNGLLFRELL
ncbi:MAG TPA: U32 family peptidase [Clostridiales bacterium]|mgnify:CR=1 FL=1|nr:U32 family peptidase [Clostridiales bacterium]